MIRSSSCFRGWALPAIALGAALSVACGSDPNGPPNGSGVTVTPDSILLFTGNTDQLTATLTGGGSAGVTFVWASADPSVAKVDQTGLVTAVAKGKTVVTASTTTPSGSRQGQAVVQVVEPSGSACAGVDTVSAWSGSLRVTWTDTRTGGNQTITVNDQLNVDFVVTNPLHGPGNVTWTGQPTGSVTLDEKITDNSTGQISTNAGSGAPVSLQDLTLIVDPDACTWRFLYTWGVNAVANGVPENPEAVAGTASQELPVGIWQQGINHSADFPAYPPSTPPMTPLQDMYSVESVFGIALFTGPDARFPGASVDFTASPTDTP
jgi:Bacterial Ig-like domain (group 2)